MDKKHHFSGFVEAEVARLLEVRFWRFYRKPRCWHDPKAASFWFLPIHNGDAMSKALAKALAAVLTCEGFIAMRELAPTRYMNICRWTTAIRLEFVLARP